MAKKRKKKLSKAYVRRLARGKAKGLSRQAARGHKPREHVSRKQAAGLTAAQSATINRFAAKQAAKDENNPDPNAMAASLRQWVRDKGYDRFIELKDLNKQRSKETRKRVRVRDRRGRMTAHISVGLHDLGEDYIDFDLPSVEDGDDFAWLFYH